MFIIIFKVLITSVIIVLVTEIAKINDRFGGLIAAMPLTTFLILFWLYYEDVSTIKISNHMTYTLLYILPTIPMFLLFPFCINKFGFWLSILISVFVTLICTLLMHYLSKNFNFKLFWNIWHVYCRLSYEKI